MTRRKLPVSMFLRPCPDCAAQWDDHQLTHESSCPYGNGLDAVTQDDARWFEAHPGAHIRIRPVTHAEVVEWAHIDGVTVPADADIEVYQLVPGIRFRTVLAA